MIPQDLFRECEKEPIHIPGLIQPYGVLLALSEPGFIIRQVSANAASLLEAEPPLLLGTSVLAHLKTAHGESLEDVLHGLQPEELTWMRLRQQGPGKAREFDGFAHRSGQSIVLELEPSPAPDALALLDFQDQVQCSVTRLQGSKDLTDLGRIATREIRRLTGYDRVMVYRFDEEWNGAVFAESLKEGMESYAGQHFPASDIPAQARQMFLQRWLRMIPDAGYRPVPLMPPLDPVSGEPLNLRLSLLRSSSPLHLEYLRNMGVAASLTVSLILDGRLWGLIACHHRTPLHLPHTVRNSCELIGRLVSSLLKAKEEAEDLDYKHRLKDVHQQLMGFMAQSEDFVSGLVKHSPTLLDLTSAGGAAAAIYFEGKWTLIGKVPRIDHINGLVKWLNTTHPGEELFATNELPRLYPPAEGFKDVASGLLAISIPKSEENYVLWFRPEVAQTVAWAGDPQKSIELEEGALKLHPRKSFALWKQVVHNKSLPWKPCELEAAAELRKSLIELDLERQFHKERAARADTEAEKQRFAFLAEASSVLASSLNATTPLLEFAQLATKRFCDWCVVYLSTEGTLARSVIVHTTPEGQAVADQLRQYPLPPMTGTSPLGAATEQEGSVFVPRVTSTWLRSVSQDPEYIAFLQDTLGIESLISVPLRTRGQFLGMIHFVRAERIRRFAREDLQLAVELARRVAIALDNAHLYKSSQEAIQARDHVMSVVSHDLRSPLGTVQLTAEALRRKLKSSVPEAVQSVAEGFLRKIETASKRMNGLIEDILNVSKMEAGRFTVGKTEVSAEALLQEAFEMLEPLAQARSLKLKREARVQGCRVQCEPERIMQVFSNLVGNAIKFTPEHGQITLRLEECGPRAVFSVEDTGPGIPAEELPYIFDRFWQASRTARQGAGLGLAITQGIIQAHGGELWVESQVGKGTKFFFSLPT